VLSRCGVVSINTAPSACQFIRLAIKLENNYTYFHEIWYRSISKPLVGTVKIWKTADSFKDRHTSIYMQFKSRSESMWTGTLTRITERQKLCTESNFLFGTWASELWYDIMVENMAVCISFTVSSAERACKAHAAQHTILLIYELHFVMEGKLTVNSWPHICLCRFSNVPNWVTFKTGATLSSETS
jgi:hypothetical protein